MSAKPSWPGPASTVYTYFHIIIILSSFTFLFLDHKIHKSKDIKDQTGLPSEENKHCHRRNVMSHRSFSLVACITIFTTMTIFTSYIYFNFLDFFKTALSFFSLSISSIFINFYQFSLSTIFIHYHPYHPT